MAHIRMIKKSINKQKYAQIMKKLKSIILAQNIFSILKQNLNLMQWKIEVIIIAIIKSNKAKIKHKRNKIIFKISHFYNKINLKNKK